MKSTKRYIPTLRSTDYVSLIANFAYRQNGCVPNRTQMQKMLYTCYGLYLSEYHRPPFTDDKPEAWLYGPVFPKSYSKYDENAMPPKISEEYKKIWAEDPNVVNIVYTVARSMSKMSATALSRWTHHEESPWSDIGGHGLISDESIKEYFESGKWIADLKETLAETD